MQENLALLLQKGIESGEFKETLPTKDFANYILESTWVVLSLSPTLSSSKRFIRHSKFIFDTLANYNN